MISRNRTPSLYIGHALYIFIFSGLSLRKSADRLSSSVLSKEIMFLYGLGFKGTFQKRYHQRNQRFWNMCIDETVIKIGSELIWLWVAIDNKTMRILRLSISKERTLFVAERFIADLVKISWQTSIFNRDGGTWYPQAFRFLK